MLGSLRFRLPAFFLFGIVVAGIVAALISLRLFQDYTRDTSLNELRREAAGIAALYGELALSAVDEGKNAPVIVPEKLEEATGDEIFYVGSSLFPGQDSGLERLANTDLPADAVDLSEPRTFEFTPPGRSRVFLAAAEPVRLDPDAPPFGALVVAKQKALLDDQWVPLVRRLGVAFLIGLAVAGLLSWWLSRRISGPVLALENAAEEIAQGNYAVRVEVGTGGDEITSLQVRFNEMAERLAATEEHERQFLMSVSHELRTPLTAIRGHVDALRDGLVDDPELVQMSLDVVAAETVRLERLVGDVLDLARLNAHRFTVLSEEVDMQRLVEQAYTAFGEEARRREIDYRLSTEGEPPVIVSDGDRVLQVVSNLLKNAFRWTPDGGTVGLGMVATNGTVSVEVSDTGPGIAQGERERIFSPFISGDTTGTGLGLPIARELAAALGGRIELESDVGKGSRFRLVLPLRRPQGLSS